MSKRLIKIEASVLQNHYYLDENDECYYVGEYTAGRGFAHSATNQLILNFKKSLDKRNTNQWQYKEQAILDVANIFKCAFIENANVTFVPIPPSKAKNDLMYDDRLVRMLRFACGNWVSPDIRELVLQKTSTNGSHATDERPCPEKLVENYEINESAVKPTPSQILVVDDVLTTGSHFKAVKIALNKIYPNIPTIGIFIARRVPETQDFDFFDTVV